MPWTCRVASGLDGAASALVRASVAASITVVAASPAAAVTRACGQDPAGNTANVLCGSPSGPCTATLVRMTSNLEIPPGECGFDLGGRSLQIEKTLQLTGLGSATFSNVADVTITGTGKLKSRGDFGRTVAEACTP